MRRSTGTSSTPCPDRNDKDNNNNDDQFSRNEDFLKLMAKGEALDGRDDLPLMTMVARDRFACFTEEELDNLLVEYLRALPDQPVDYDAVCPATGSALILRR